MRHSRYNSLREGERISDDNALDSIKVTYRPKGGSEWLDIESKQEQENELKSSTHEEKKDDKDRQSNPHGTKYKPEMYR